MGRHAVGRTSVVASRSADMKFLEEPSGFSIRVVRVLWSAANLGLFCKTASSIGGNMISW